MSELVITKKYNYENISSLDILFGCTFVPEYESHYKTHRIIEVLPRKILKDKVIVKDETFLEFK